MRSQPRHFHPAAAAALALVAAYFAVDQQYDIAAFLGVGAFVALAYWRAAKAGLVD